jgi:hypothetical protein
MSGEKHVGGHGSKKEAEYFHKKERELVEKLRQKAAEVARRHELADATGVADEAILDDLNELGLDRETVRLLHLVPLVEVAWADGEVSLDEKDLILHLADARGVKDESPAREKLLGWLSKRPPRETFEKALRALHAILEAGPEGQAKRAKTSLVDLCKEVASASGGFFGFGTKISDEERAAIEHVGRKLSESHGEAARRIVGEA